MKEGSLGDVLNVMMELQLALKDYFEVSDVWGGRQSEVVRQSVLGGDNFRGNVNHNGI